MYQKPELLELGSAANLIQGEKQGVPELASVEAEQRALDAD